MRIYTTDFCKPCQKVKDFINENNIDVEIINIHNMIGKKINDMGDFMGEKDVNMLKEKKPVDLTIPLMVDGKVRVRGADNIINYLKNRMGAYQNEY